jgi:ABC-type Fe3+ transport system substrate-binding protein
VTNEARAGRVVASVIDGAQTTPVLKRENLVEKWMPDADLPKHLFDPDGYWIACNYYINTPGFNTELVRKGTEPKTFEDLLDPKWKGKLAWNTQPSISAGQGFAGSVLIAWGEQRARAYLAQLAKQNITPLKVSGRQVLDLVIAGEYPIGLQIFNNHAFISASKGAAVDWIKMQPPLVTYSVMSALKGAPSPNAGKLLIDFIVSEEGQRIFADAGELPVHPGVKLKDPTMIPDGATFKGTFLTPEQLDAQLPVWTKLYDDYFK